VVKCLPSKREAPVPKKKKKRVECGPADHSLRIGQASNIHKESHNYVGSSLGGRFN
jgi:hypothetical protein